jgi:putative ABC transport system substrate-binding protein
LLPSAANFALLVNPANPYAETQAKDVRGAAARLGLHVDVLHASAEDDFDAAFAILKKLGIGGLVIANDDLFIGRSEQLAALSIRHAVAAIFEHSTFAAGGGLMSYGTSLMETYHQTGVACGFVLKGAAVADLPVFLADNIEVFVNLKTAQTLGIAVPPALLAHADEVIR